MQVSRRNAYATIRTDGGLLPADLLMRIAEGDRSIEGLTPESYHLAKSERLNEAATRAWNRLQGAWEGFRAGMEKLPASDTGTTLTRERWLLILFQELGYGRLQAAKAIDIDGKSYPISHLWQSTPVHLVSFRQEIDRRTPGARGASRVSPYSLVQELLNRGDDHLWGFVSNGLRLRLLRDNASLTRAACVEFDLQSMMEGEVYSDFFLLFLLCHQSRVEVPEGKTVEHCWLERWYNTSLREGTRVLDHLRDGVERAIEALGGGFLGHPANTALRDKLRAGTLTTQDYYRQVLRVVYRLLFLFVAEDRDLLLLPAGEDARLAAARDLYTRHYSTQRLRRLAERRRSVRHADLYRALRLVFAKLHSGCPELALPALGSYLFAPTSTPDLNDADIANADLLAAVWNLTFTADGNVRRSVDYRNLGPEELGSVYESLLEMHPDVHLEAGKFELRVAAGSERKTTGSYYTPSSLVNCLLDSALEPVLDEACQKQDPKQALLDLKVCDPACGSGHFLIAAARRIAKRLAAVRAGEDEPAPESIQHALRDVVGRCIYGVDINPMAVELCKINLWMEALEPGRPLSFLDHHIRPGNSLLGTTPSLMKRGIPDDAFKPIEDDEKGVCSGLKRRNRDERRGQGLLPFGQPQWLKLGNLAQSFANLTGEDDSTSEALAAKEHHFAQLVHSAQYENAWRVADAWCAAFLCEKRRNSPLEITEGVFRRWEANPDHLLPAEREELLRLRNEHRFFHWHLAFPEVFKPQPTDQIEKDAVTGWAGGFDCVLGNPPFVNAIEGAVSVRCKLLSRYCSPDLGGTADQAFEFLNLSCQVVSAEGFVALVQPRSLLNAPACDDLRGTLMKRLPPRLVFIGKRPDLFAGAAVFVCLVCLGGTGRETMVAIDDEPGTAAWRNITLQTTNWWGEVVGAAEGLTVSSVRNTVPLGERFEITASMTTGDAYDLIPYVIDAEDGDGAKLVTTGLIDPGVCLWGQESCRYLKRDFFHPRIKLDDTMSASIRRRLQRSRRPKILVAGLSKRIECFLDRNGEFVGAVSTFSIYEPEDDIAALQELCDQLLTEDASVRFRLELGGNAMGGGNTTMKKGFLESFPVPKEI